MNRDAHRKGGLGFKIQSGAGLEEQGTVADFKESRISTRKGEGVGAEGIVSDQQISDLDGGSGVTVFWKW